MELLILLASVILIVIMLDWWDKNSPKIEPFLDKLEIKIARLPSLIYLKLKDLYSKLRRR